MPRSPVPIGDVYRDVTEKVMAYPMGNVHPRFWGWYMGTGNFTGALGIASLDGLGVCGAGAHTLQEHILVDSLPQRGRLLTGLLMELS